MATIRVARLYDGVHPKAGPYFAADHPTVADEAERRRLAGFLTGGAPLLHTTALDRDLLDPRGARRVPMGYRTDGVWVWSDAVSYYLERHRLAPDPELATYIRALGYACPAPEPAAVRRALAAFYGRPHSPSFVDR